MEALNLNLSLERLQEIVGVSRMLTWQEFCVYSRLLCCTEAGASVVRINQTELAQFTGYSVSAVKRYLDRLRSLGLINSWRGPEGGNYYRVILPLTGAVVQAVREHLPEFQMKPKRRSRKTPHGEPQAADIPSPPSTQPDIDNMVIDKPITATSSPSAEPALDPEISALLDELERLTRRNTICRFLESLNVLAPQLSSEDPIRFDRPLLLTYLVQADANSLSRLTELVEAFAD